MIARCLWPLIAVCLLVACESPLANKRAVEEVLVDPEDLHLPVGQSACLEARAFDAQGVRIAGSPEFRWASSDSAVVAVSPSGMVTARAAGSARIRATAGGAVGEVVVGVAAPLPAECPSLVAMAVGEVYAAPVGEGSLLCFAGGADGAEYALIPFHGGTTASATVELQIEVLGGQTPEAPPAGTTMEGMAGIPDLRAASGAEARDPVWEAALRRREAEQLLPLAAGLRSDRVHHPAAARASVAVAEPAAGATLALNVNAAQACADPQWREGEVVALTERAVVVADRDNPSGGFTANEYEEIGRQFDRLVYPVVTRNFGEPSDVDGNRRVVIFFTRAVNEMTDGPTGTVGGFFFSRDLFRRTGRDAGQGCAGSNEAEILYLMVPDPARAEANPAFSKSSVRRNVVALLAHEFQHLINASQRLFVQGSASFEETWLNEGLSHIAEELVGNHAARLGRGENVDYPRLRESAESWEAFTMFHRSNFGRLGEHLERPWAAGLFDPSAPLAGRGAAWQFLRYAADRRGGDETNVWLSLTSSPTTGVRNLQRTFGVEVVSWMRDWAVSVYVDDAIPDVDPIWTQPSWHFRSVFSGIRGDRSYPLGSLDLPANGSRTVSIAPGGAMYARFGVPAGGRTEVRTSWAAGLTPPRRVLLSVVRTR